MLNPKEFPLKKNHIKLPPSSFSKINIFAKGEFGLISLESKYIFPNELEAIRKLVVRYIRNNRFIINSKTKPFLYFRIFPFVSLTTKPKAVRMGKGKGLHTLWVYPLAKGQVILEIKGLSPILSLELLNKIRSKLSVTSKIISNILNK